MTGIGHLLKLMGRAMGQACWSLLLLTMKVHGINPWQVGFHDMYCFLVP